MLNLDTIMRFTQNDLVRCCYQTIHAPCLFALFCQRQTQQSLSVKWRTQLIASFDSLHIAPFDLLLMTSTLQHHGCSTTSNNGLHHNGLPRHGHGTHQLTVTKSTRSPAALMVKLFLILMRWLKPHLAVLQKIYPYPPVHCSGSGLSFFLSFPAPHFCLLMLQQDLSANLTWYPGRSFCKEFASIHEGQSMTTVRYFQRLCDCNLGTGNHESLGMWHMPFRLAFGRNTTWVSQRLTTANGQQMGKDPSRIMNSLFANTMSK